MRTVFAPLSILALALALFAGCAKPPAPTTGGAPSAPTKHAASQPAQGPARTIALVMKAGGNPFFDAMQKGAEAAAAELGVTLKPFTISDESSDAQQIDIVGTLVVQRVDAILIAPANSKGLVAPLVEARKAGILVVNVDNRLDADAIQQAGLELLCYVGADNEEGGRLGGKRLCELLEGKGEVAMLEGRRGVDNAEARKRGFEKACKDFADIRIVDSQSANWDLAEAQNKLTAMLAAHPGITGVFCANDMMAIGAIAALEEKGLSGRIKVVSYDNIEPAQKAIREGKLAATIEQNPGEMGSEAVRAAVKALNGETVEKEILVPLEVVDAATLGG